MGWGKKIMIYESHLITETPDMDRGIQLRDMC